MEGTGSPSDRRHLYLKEEAAYLHADDDKPQVVEPSDRSSIVCQFCASPGSMVRGVFHASAGSGIQHLGDRGGLDLHECVARMAQVLAEEPEGTPGCLAGRSGPVAAPGPTRPDRLPRQAADQEPLDNRPSPGLLYR